MNHPIYKIISFKLIGPYTLQLEFNDGLIKEIYFKEILKGEVYSPLKELKFFNMVSIDPEINTIVWSNGADFDLAVLHDWEEYKAELAERSKNWELVIK